MAPASSVAILSLWGMLLIAGVVAQRKGTSDSSSCDSAHACYPWQIGKGPYCARGDKISFRFFLDVAEEDKSLPKAGQVCNVSNAVTSQHYVTYSFCPGVDQLQAFTLNSSGMIGGTTLKNKVRVTTNGDAWLRVFGFGTSSNRDFPLRNESTGAVKVIGACEDSTATSSQTGSSSFVSSLTAIVPFLILNVSMDKGHFQYYADYPQAAGVGFVPSCETRNGVDTCLLDASLPCMGPPNRKNCAKCYANEEVNTLANTNIQVWVAYYGTDRQGRQLRSGSNNPMNFRTFAGGTFYSSISKSLDHVRSGNFNDDPGSIKDGGITAH